MNMKCIILAFLTSVLATNGAISAEPKPMGVYGKWSAWSYSDRGKDRCFIYSIPDIKTPATLDHGAVMFFVRTRPHSAARTEASFQTGYKFSSSAAIQVTVGDKVFHMTPSGNSAWLRRVGVREGEFLASLEGGQFMTVEAASSRGNETSYRFSLSGVTGAMQLLHQACP